MSGVGFTRPVRALYQAQDFLREKEKGRLCIDSRVLKKSPRRGPTLESTDVTQPVEAYAEACNHTLGGVLVQNGHPIRSESLKQSGAENSYTVFKKGTLVIVCSQKDMKLYSHGSTHVR